ncbi:MAG: bifunctional protein-serine/threonine kinase/phosphatase [Hyphomicrobiaceae bacterium]
MTKTMGLKKPAISVGQHSTAGRKDRNDDSYGVLIPEPVLLETKGIAMAIADGMSSSEAAKEASETCVRSFLTDYFATHQSWTVKTSVERVLSAVNRWLHSQSEAHYDSGRGMVSTFSGIVLKSSLAHIFHAGDSRIYLIRDGAIERLTNDHRVRVSGKQEYLSRAFGISRDLAVDYRTLPIERGDILLFTTDGVHDFLRDGQMANIVRAEPNDLDGAAARIVAAAFANNSNDNLTCQIVRIDDPGATDQKALQQRLSALPFPPEISPGSTFEGYKIVRELHLSNRTQVYLAEDQETHERVVIKTPSVNFEDDATYIEMFTREEWVGQLVSSPHVLKVLAPKRLRKSLYYVTEYFEGQTLRQWMLDHPDRDLEAVRGIVEQIVKGLRVFHRKEILHRDLKPENILIDRSGLVKIIDFGSSRVAGIEEIASPVGRPALLGTEGYTAPEYHRDVQPTTRSDIYSLGVIAYELLTGQLPYGRGFTTRRDVDRLAYIPATQLNPNVPRWVDAALAKAVHKDPLQRTEVLSALVEDLRKPNTALITNRAVPLIERNPIAFWKVVSLVLAVVNLCLLVLLFPAR